jgi:hypothetical protein
MDISKGIAARGLRSSNPHVFRRVIAGNVKYQNFLLKKAKFSVSEKHNHEVLSRCNC